MEEEFSGRTGKGEDAVFTDDRESPALVNGSFYERETHNGRFRS